MSTSYAKNEIVWCGCEIVQILKVRFDEDGSPRYKVRHYNALFGGRWVGDGDLRPYPLR